MSWLRSRRRTLDIVSEIEENSGSKTLSDMSLGTYNSTNVDGNLDMDVTNNNNGLRPNNARVSTDNALNSPISVDTTGRNTQTHTFMNGLIETTQNEVTVINVASCKASSLDSFHLEGIDDGVGDIVRIEIEEQCKTFGGKLPRRWTFGSDSSQVSANILTVPDNFLETLSDSELCKKDAVEEEEEREIKKNFKSCLAHPRLSLDSKIGMITTSEIDILNVLPKLREQCETPETKQRKSISWAEDLETVHEIEKIKTRRISLSALFKKL